MGLYHKDGRYVGGCQSQILGTISVIAVLALFIWAADSGINIDIWAIFRWIIIIAIAIFVILCIIGLFIGDKKDDDDKDDDSQKGIKLKF